MAPIGPGAVLAGRMVILLQQKVPQLSITHGFQMFSRGDRLHRLALLGILLLGFALRVYRADHQELWGDEGAKIVVVNRDLAHLFDPASEVHPRLFHAFLFFWYRIFGLQLWGLRMLPVLLGQVSIPLIYALAHRLFASRPAALAAAFALALSPFQVAYSQDLTMYSLLIAMTILSFYALVRALGEGARWPAWGAYIVASSLMIHTHYYAVLTLVAQNVFVLLYHRRRIGRWLLAQGAIAAVTLPWLYLQYSLLAGQAVRETADLALNHLLQVLWRGGVAFTVGSTFPATLSWVAWLYLLLAVSALILLLRSPQRREAGVLVGAWLLVPPLMVWGFDFMLEHFNERFLSTSLPPLLLLLSWACVRLPWRRVSTALTLGTYALTSAVSLGAWYFDPAYLKSTYGEMMGLVGQMAQPGDLLLVSGPGQVPMFDLYHPAGVDARFLSPDSVLTMEAAERDFPAFLEGYKRVWLVMYGDPNVYDPRHNAEAWLGSRGYKAFSRNYVGSYLTLYVLPEANAPPDLRPYEAEFVGGPRLIGYAIEPATPRAGQTIYVTLRWLATKPMAVDYTVFTHVLDPFGAFVVGSDSQPVSGTRPTTSWAPGTVVTDNYALLLPAELASGEYAVEVGIYDLATMVRLTVSQPGGVFDHADHLLLESVRVASQGSG
ncbi:MAG: glycosyltransferase family 39 protein [Anaerolineae bacterium]